MQGGNGDSYKKSWPGNLQVSERTQPVPVRGNTNCPSCRKHEVEWYSGMYSTSVRGFCSNCGYLCVLTGDDVR